MADAAAGGRLMKSCELSKRRLVFESVSSVARRHGVRPNLLYRWRQLMLEGGTIAVSNDDRVTANRDVRQWEGRVRELERQLGRKTLEVEILKEALSKSQAKKTDLAHQFVADGKFAMKAVADTLDVARSNLADRAVRGHRSRTPYRRADAPELIAELRRLVDERPTYGYRRITALRNRRRAAFGEPNINHKRVYRLMRQHGTLLERHSGHRPGRTHDGKVIVIRSNLRWCSDAFEIICWNGEIVRVGFAIDAHDREAISWTAVTGCKISGDDVRDMMLEAVEKRFGTNRAAHPVEWLSDNGSTYTAKETRHFASQLNLLPCFTPVKSPESNGLAESLRKDLQTRRHPRQSLARRRSGAPAPRWMVRGRQRKSSSQSTWNAIS